MERRSPRPAVGLPVYLIDQNIKNTRDYFYLRNQKKVIRTKKLPGMPKNAMHLSTLREDLDVFPKSRINVRQLVGIKIGNTFQRYPERPNR
jgi:hypothetical protein